MLRKILFGGDFSGSGLNAAGLALLRIFAGVSLMLGHGIDKMPPADGFVSFVGKIGFPMPEMFAWSAALSEFAGGALLALGLFTRLSSFFVAFTMFVAAFVVNYGAGFEKQELGLVYMFIAVLFLLRGGGRWSVDAFFGKEPEVDAAE